MELPRPLRGVITAMLTPLRAQDALDHAGLERLIEHLLSGGVHGLFILGSTGEAPSLSYRLKAELIERTCRQVASRVPILVGITDTSWVEAANLAGKAAAYGAQGVVTSAPYYFSANQEELLDYVAHLAAAVPPPLFLYNAPAYTHHTFEPSTVLRAASIPNIIGLKDSGGDMKYFREVVEVMKDRPDFTLLVGPEELLAEAVMLGGHGGMCGGSNISPSLFVDLYQAATARDLDKVRSLQGQVAQLGRTIYHVRAGDSGLLSGMKCAVSLRGICDDFMALPFRTFGPEERAQVQRHLNDLGLAPSPPMAARESRS